MMTDTERLILENQGMILHALRLMVSRLSLPTHQFVAISDQMSRTRDALDADQQSQQR
jgi:hypothetical protein